MATVAFAAALTVVVPGASRADAATPAPKVAGELIVGFDDSASRAQQRSAVAEADARITQRLPGIDAAVIRADDPATAKSDLAGNRQVTFVEPNYLLRADKLPNDPFFNEQWGLRNTGQLGGNAGGDIAATTAWDVSTGGNTTVAVIDTGIDYSHPDLDANIWRNTSEPINGLDDDNDGFVDDVRGADFANGDSDPSDDAGHGTHVGGIIAAEGNNGTGVAGVNWNAKLMPLKFLDANGEGNTADAASAIDYAVSHGARVINASWGGPAFSQTLYEAVRRAAERDVIFVAAAGNEGHDADSAPDYPAAFDLPNVISVAASDRRDHLLPYSNYGRQTVDLAAPGDDIFSTVPTSIDSSGYANYSGTSMAAPSVAGTVALYLGRSPEAPGSQARNAVLQATDSVPSLAGKTATGGRLDAAKALGAHPQANPSVDRDAPSPFALRRPRNRYATPRRGVKFKWQRATDASQIQYYKLYVDGRKVKTVKDRDGKGGAVPITSVRMNVPAGKHRWFVKAWDYAGNVRRSRVARGKARSSRSLYIGKRYR